MKKFISMLVICSMLCSFTACGEPASSETMQSPPEYQQKISVSDIDIQYSTESQPETTTETSVRTGYTAELPPETTEPYVDIQYSTEYQPEITASYVDTQYSTEYQPETTATKNPENVRFSADIYSAIENYLECINNNDIYGIIKASYPDKYADAIKKMSDNTDIALEDIIGDMYKEKNMHLSGANSYEEMSSDYILQFSRILGAFEPMRAYIEKNGADNIEDVDFLTVLKSICGITDGSYFEITRAVKINCNISSDTKDIQKRDIVLYYVDGEGWKIDIVFMPCIQDIEKIENNQFINSLYNLINDITDLIDLNIVDKIIDYDEYYDDFDDFGDIFEDGLNDFFSDISRY